METKYSTNIVNPNDPYELNAFYKERIDLLLNSVNGELISILDISYKQNLGKEFRYFFDGKAFIMVYRVFYIDKRAYMFGVATTPEYDKNKSMVNFLDSFNIQS